MKEAESSLPAGVRCADDRGQFVPIERNTGPVDAGLQGIATDPQAARKKRQAVEWLGALVFCGPLRSHEWAGVN